MGGYVAPKPVEDLATTKLHCEVVYGCLHSGKVQEAVHNQIIESLIKNPRLKVYYKKRYNHSKIYLWKIDNNPIEALVGSANFSTKGLENDDQEVLCLVSNPKELQTISDYIQDAKSGSIIADPAYKNFTSSVHSTAVTTEFKKFSILSTTPPEVSLTSWFLWSEENKCFYTHRAGGFNWGFDKYGKPAAKRRLSAMYIPIPKRMVTELPDFFPNKGINLNYNKGQGHRNRHPVADAIFDDKTTMKISFEGHGGKYIKQLTSYPHADEMGEYFRQRLGVKLGGRVEYSDLEKYGRKDVRISLIDDGIYAIDFSI